MSQQKDKRTIDIEAEKQIQNLYQNNCGVGQIAKIVNVDRRTVVRVLKRNDLYSPIKSRYKINQDKIKRNERIVILTYKGYSIRQISSELNISHATVSRIRSKYMHEQVSLIRDDCRAQCLFNEHFFESIETEAQAYWLGFLYADGCITKTHKTIRIDISSKDRAHVEKFREAIQYFSAPIKYRHNVDSVSISVNSKKMISDLCKLGCHEQKSLALTFPNEMQVPQNMVRHFMRGYFDGDGCISITNPKRYIDCIITLCGTHKFCQKYQEIIDYAIRKTTHSKIKDTHNIMTITWHGAKQGVLIYHYLYDDATIFLPRKEKIFKELLSRLERRSQERSRV